MEVFFVFINFVFYIVINKFSIYGIQPEKSIKLKEKDNNEIQ